MVAKVTQRIEVFVGKASCGHFKFKLSINYGNGEINELYSPACFEAFNDCKKAAEEMGADIEKRIWHGPVAMPEVPIVH